MDPDKLKRMQEKQKVKRQQSYERHMAKKKDQFKINEFLSEVRWSNKSGSHVNCFRYNPSSTDAHEDMKYHVYKQLRKWGHDCIVEAIFNNGKRADVIDLTEGIVYEITYSETEEELSKKTSSYPEVFEIRRVDAKQEFKEELLL